MRTVNKQRLDYVTEHWREKYDFELADDLGCSSATIRNYRHRLDHMRNVRWTDEMVSKMQQMYAEGMNARQIGETLGCSTRAVQQQRYRVNKQNFKTPQN